MGWSAAATIGGQAINGIAGAIGSGAASDAQQKAYQQAQDTIKQFYGQAQGNLQPFITGGTSAFNNLLQMTGNGPGGTGTGALNTPFAPTQAQLASTPGYQFTLNQGLKGVQNSAAAKGLGTSGEALAGAENYAQGLAGTQYQQQFQNYLTQNQQIYNMLSGLSGAGQSSATNLGQMGLNAASGIANAQVGQGNAQASGILGMANALGGAAQGVGQGLGQYGIAQSLFPNSFGTATSAQAASGTNMLNQYAQMSPWYNLNGGGSY